MNALTVVHISDAEMQLQWLSNTSNDMIADSALALLLGIDASPATVKSKFELMVALTAVTNHPHSHSHSHSHSQSHTADFDRLHTFLTAHFGNVSEPRHTVDGGSEDELLVMDVDVDGVIARIDLISMVRHFLGITNSRLLQVRVIR